ncbi:MAG: hypothetical protein ABL983_09305 [Nitrospira sp.]
MTLPCDISQRRSMYVTKVYGLAPGPVTIPDKSDAIMDILK